VAIEGYVGRPGSGKSYTLTARVLQEAERGRTCFTNFGLKHPNVFTFGPEDLLHLPPGLIAIDEAHLWFPARQALKLPPSWLAGMSQTRKRGWDLLWAVQHEARVDRVIRDVSSWMWLCSSWWSWKGHPLLFKAECYEPEFFRKPKRKMLSRWRLFSQDVANAYDTYETLAVAKHALSKNDAYAPAESWPSPVISS
jgi:zona occludens toxin (predicted ATPase)